MQDRALKVCTSVSLLLAFMNLPVPEGTVWAQGRTTQQEADTVFYNGKILTVDENFTVAEALAISDGRFTAVGQDSEILKLSGPGTVAIDLKGRTVTPGLIDTHRHIYARSSRSGPQIDMRAVRTKDDVLNQIKGLMEKHQFEPGQWIYFGRVGGSISVAQAKILLDDLNRWELDKVTPDNPVAVSVINDLNGFLVNSKAIEILWETHGDFIEKYGRYWIDSSAQPEGHLEPPASRLVNHILPTPAPEVLAPIQKRTMEELSSMGLTTVSTRMPPESLAAYQLLESKGEMTLRIGYGLMEYFGTVTDPAKDLKGVGDQIGKGSETLWVTSVAPTAIDGASTRACTDQERHGAFGAIDRWWPVGQCHTEIEYSGARGKGAPIKGHYYKEWIYNSALNGVRFANTHVAGDRSVSNALDMVEEIQRQLGPSATHRWAFDHCTLVNPKDFQRAARLGIIFSCSPKYIDGVAPEAAKVYGEKVAHTFVVPVKSLIEAGVKVVFEADRDVYLWDDMELLMTRKLRDGTVWGPQEAIDRVTLLKMITRWAAEYVLKENELGSIEEGKLADLVIIDRDYMSIPKTEMSEVQVLLTMLGGKTVFMNPHFAQEYSLPPGGAVIATYQELQGRH